jgi:hypothetical protein
VFKSGPARPRRVPSGRVVRHRSDDVAAAPESPVQAPPEPVGWRDQLPRLSGSPLFTVDRKERNTLIDANRNACTACGVTANPPPMMCGPDQFEQAVPTALGTLLGLRWSSVLLDGFHDWDKFHKRILGGVLLLVQRMRRTGFILKFLKSTPPCKGLHISRLLRKVRSHLGQLRGMVPRMADRAHLSQHIIILLRHVFPVPVANWVCAMLAKYLLSYQVTPHFDSRAGPAQEAVQSSWAAFANVAPHLADYVFYGKTARRAPEHADPARPSAGPEAASDVSDGDVPSSAASGDDLGHAGPAGASGDDLGLAGPAGDDVSEDSEEVDDAAANSDDDIFVLSGPAQAPQAGVKLPPSMHALIWHFNVFLSGPPRKTDCNAGESLFSSMVQFKSPVGGRMGHQLSIVARSVALRRFIECAFGIWTSAGHVLPLPPSDLARLLRLTAVTPGDFKPKKVQQGSKRVRSDRALKSVFWREGRGGRLVPGWICSVQNGPAVVVKGLRPPPPGFLRRDANVVVIVDELVQHRASFELMVTSAIHEGATVWQFHQLLRAGVRIYGSAGAAQVQQAPVPLSTLRDRFNRAAPAMPFILPFWRGPDLPGAGAGTLADAATGGLFNRREGREFVPLGPAQDLPGGDSLLIPLRAEVSLDRDRTLYVQFPTCDPVRAGRRHHGQARPDAEIPLENIELLSYDRSEMVPH